VASLSGRSVSSCSLSYRCPKPSHRIKVRKTQFNSNLVKIVYSSAFIADNIAGRITTLNLDMSRDSRFVTWKTNQCFQLFIQSPYGKDSSYRTFSEEAPPTCEVSIQINSNVRKLNSNYRCWHKVLRSLAPVYQAIPWASSSLKLTQTRNEYLWRLAASATHILNARSKRSISANIPTKSV
jgi:hypothetical protein